MAKVLRQVIKIDEELCDGCGLCVPACAEGAIQIIDGKARLVSETYCDGLGACLGECPQGAISFEEREAEEFDEAAVAAYLRKIGREYNPHAHDHLHEHSHLAKHSAPPEEVSDGKKRTHEGREEHEEHHHPMFPVGGGCPSARTLDFRAEEREETSDLPKLRSELRQWPVKLNLVSPSAPYFQDADLLVAADCAPFAYAATHPEFIRGKTIVIGCPKFDDLDFYQRKLEAIVTMNDIHSITVLIMEVPCCSGLLHIAREAVKAAGKDIPVSTAVVTLRGEIAEPSGLIAM